MASLQQLSFLCSIAADNCILVCDAGGCTEDVMRLLKLSLTEFSLPKFYQLFGISKVKSAAVSAFRSSYRPGDRSFAYTPPEQERVSLQSLEVITDALLEIMEVCNTSVGCVVGWFVVGWSCRYLILRQSCWIV